jgi:hypothetical protein
MEGMFIKEESKGKTCKTKSGKDIDSDKYRRLCDNLKEARERRAQKAAGEGEASQPKPEPKPKTEAGGTIWTDVERDKAMQLLALQDRRIRELNTKLQLVQKPKPEPEPEPEPVQKSEPIQIPSQPYRRHWALNDD